MCDGCWHFRPVDGGRALQGVTLHAFVGQCHGAHLEAVLMGLGGGHLVAQSPNLEQQGVV